MKRSKLFIVVAIFAFLLFVTTGCADDSGAGVHTHKYGEWTFVVEPTETTAGTIAKVCPKCNDRQEVEVAALTDASVWSVTEVLSTCQKAGSRTYVSEYGTVVVELPKEEHVYGEWTLVTEPTETATGSATRTCKLSLIHI